MKHVLLHLPFIALLLVALPWLLPAVETMQSTMSDASQHMEYIWLIPCLSALLFWQRRHQILAAIRTPDPAPLLALPLLLLAAFFLFFGLRGGQARFLQTAAILLLEALPLACYGKRLFKVVWFPILLLAFVMPVGFLDNFTVPLRRASVTVTAFILNGLGISVRQMGTAIIATSHPPFQLDVADPCSGIRSLVALFVGTAAYGAFVLTNIKHRWILFLSSVPIAFLGNILRLLLTAGTCHFVSQHAGMTLHDHALFIVAPFYAYVVFQLTDFLKKKQPKSCVSTVESEELIPKTTPRKTWILLSLIAIFLICFKTYANHMPPLIFESDAFLRSTFTELPNSTMTFPWFCQNRACLFSQNLSVGETPPDTCPHCEGEVARVSRAELDILPSDTQSRKVTYTFNNGDIFTVALVIAGKNRMSIHRPELCLPSQGYILSERQVISLSEKLPFATFSLRREGQTRAHGFGYVFLNSRTATASNLHRVLGDSWQRSIHNTIQRWAMVTITSPHYDFQTPEGETALRDFMTVFYPTLFATP
jgi:exosortase